MFYLRAIFRSIYDARWLTEQKDNGKKAANYIVLFISKYNFIVEKIKKKENIIIEKVDIIARDELENESYFFLFLSIDLFNIFFDYFS